MRVIKLLVITLLINSLIACSIVRESDVNAEHQAKELIDLGVLALQENDLDRAEAAFDLASEIAPIPEALDGLGCVALKRGQVRLAEYFFISAYEYDSNYTTALANLAFLYDTNGLHSDAENLYKTTLLTDPRNFKARNNYAALLADYNDKKDVELSKKQLLKAEALAAHPVIVNNLKKLGAQTEVFE